MALSPTRAKGHVAERRATAPRSPSRPEGAAMYIRAVMRRCTEIAFFIEFIRRPPELVFAPSNDNPDIRLDGLAAFTRAILPQPNSINNR